MARHEHRNDITDEPAGMNRRTWILVAVAVVAIAVPGSIYLNYELGRRQHLCADALGRRVQVVADANASLLKAGLPFHLSWNDLAKDNPDIVKQLHD
ncbi:MAG: hypothetical protein EBT09_13000 [Actinobacteria bacterium]|nr:hypothetical protein [Actinomycetota bacterium]